MDKSKKRDIILGMFSSFGVVFAVETIIGSIRDYIINNEIPIHRYFPRILSLIQILAIALLGYYLYKKINLSKAYSKTLLILLSLYIFGLLIVFLLVYIFKI